MTLMANVQSDLLLDASAHGHWRDAVLEEDVNVETVEMQKGTG